MLVPSSDGVAVAVHDLGGRGEPLIVAHATGFCGGAYAPLANELAERFHVWALDFRGHGESTAPGSEALAWERMTDDLEAAVGAISDGEPIAAFGHSMGGACVLRLEMRRPGTFRWAYVFEPIVVLPDMPMDRPNPLADGAARRRATFPSKADALARYASRPPLDIFRADALLAYVEHGFRDEPDGSVTLRCAPADEAAVFRASGSITVPQLRDVHIPVTVATGTVSAGEFSPAMFGEAQADALPDGTLQRHESLGHFGPFQDPVAVARSILTVADRATPRR